MYIRMLYLSNLKYPSPYLVHCDWFIRIIADPNRLLGSIKRSNQTKMYLSPGIIMPRPTCRQRKDTVQ